MTFAATILTLYPEMFPGPLGHSIAGRAMSEGKWACETVQIRDFAEDKHRTVDDTPAGGGAGMVLKCDVLARAVDSVLEPLPLGEGVGDGGSAVGGGSADEASHTHPPNPLPQGRGSVTFATTILTLAGSFLHVYTCRIYGAS